MDHITAQKLMSIYQRIGVAISEADPVIRTLPESERSRYLRGIADMTMFIWDVFQHPIVREYPELDPDKEYFQSKNK